MSSLIAYMTGETQYPYALGQTKGGDTSEAAQRRAARNTLNDQMRDAALACFRRAPHSAEGIAADLWGAWRQRYPDESAFIQDCRRRCSELVKDGRIVDSGERDYIKGGTRRMWRLA